MLTQPHPACTHAPRRTDHAVWRRPSARLIIHKFAPGLTTLKISSHPPDPPHVYPLCSSPKSMLTTNCHVLRFNFSLWPPPTLFVRPFFANVRHPGRKKESGGAGAAELVCQAGTRETARNLPGVGERTSCCSESRRVGLQVPGVAFRGASAGVANRTTVYTTLARVSF